MAVAERREVDPLHVHARRLQAVPQRRRRDPAPVIRPCGVVDTVAVLQDQRVEYMLRCFLIPLLPWHISQLRAHARSSAECSPGD